MPYSELLTPEQVARRLHVTTATVLAWLESGEMAGRKTGPFWRIRAPDLRRFLAIHPPVRRAAASARSGTLSSVLPTRRYTRAEMLRFLEGDRLEDDPARPPEDPAP